jgi:beta-galactosidase
MYYAYGGDFGEARGTHGGNFVCDGLLFPDRTPSPALLDVKRIIQPIAFALEDGKVVIRNKYDFIDLSHLQLAWKVEKWGEEQEGGDLDISRIQSHQTGLLDIPDHLHPLDTDSAGATDGAWITISATTRGGTWADPGHEIAWAQFPCRISGNTESNGAVSNSTEISPVIEDSTIRVGPAVFDIESGRLVSLGAIPVSRAELDLWRAPTDNDSGGEMNAQWPEIRVSNLDKWLDAGLDRVQHQVDSVILEGDQLVVITRVGPAVLDRYLDVIYSYTAVDGGQALGVSIDVNPKGNWSAIQLPRLGIALTLDKPDLESAKWFGLGPGEAYPDTRSGVKMGLYTMSIDDMQTPYVMPQENGNRKDVSFAKLTDAEGHGLEIRGEPTFDLTVRRWKSEDLHVARRRTELVASEKTFVSIDHANSGIGSASTGPGVLEPYRIVLEEGKAVKFGFVLRVI